MAKKYLKKALFMTLALTLCLGLAAPAFAQDAYYALQVVDEKGEKVTNLDGVNKNGWSFVGKGEASDALESGSVSFENGELPDGYVAPDANDSTTLEGGHFHNGDKNVGEQVDATVEHFHDIGGYTYDDGTGIVVGEKTYTVTWTGAKVPEKKDGGISVDLSECSNKDEIKQPDGAQTGATPGNIRFGEGDDDTVHVDGTATLHDNTEITVVVKNYTNGAHDEKGTNLTENDKKYVRDSEDATIKAAAGEITDNKYDSENYDLTVDGNTATYEEKTYEVTYKISGALTDVAGYTDQSIIKGKVSEGWESQKEALIANTVNAMGAEGGYYSFSGWTAEVDEETGNVILKAICTFVPYLDLDLDLDDTGAEVEIDDPAIPLADGPITRAQFIDYLWRHEGEPEGAACTFTDVPEDHEFVLALGWAEEYEVAVAYEDGTFEPDELVTVADVREFLGNFARVFGTNAVEVADLTTLTGGDDEAVLNCAQVLAEFFGEEYAVPELDGLEADAA